jgi:transposase
MNMRDEFGVFFSDEQFADLFSPRGQPALSPWRLALVTIMQFAENLTDRPLSQSRLPGLSIASSLYQKSVGIS